MDVDSLRASSQPTAREVQRSYNDNLELYSTPEQVRASHILLKTAGKKEEEVKAKAEQILKELKAGADFAALAKKYSEDEASAKLGGDVDYFSKGKMDPAFDEAAFKLEPGELSDVVKSQYGFHIIKLTDKKPATTRTLDEVRPQIVDQLSCGAREREGRRPGRDDGEGDFQGERPRQGGSLAPAQGAGVRVLHARGADPRPRARLRRRPPRRSRSSPAT